MVEWIEEHPEELEKLRESKLNWTGRESDVGSRKGRPDLLEGSLGSLGGNSWREFLEEGGARARKKMPIDNSRQSGGSRPTNPHWLGGGVVGVSSGMCVCVCVCCH